MEVSICIVNWNTKDLLYNCIKSIEEKTFGVRYEILVVDNNSADESVEMVQREFSNCNLILSERNLGFAKGNNVAVKKASGKYILYLNPDTELVTNAIYGMYLFLEEQKEFGAVGCTLLNPDGTIQFTGARTFPNPFNQFCYLTMLNRLFPRSKFFSTIEIGYWDHMESREIDCLSGACIMVRKDIIDKLKGFDESIFMYAEDVDLCYRIRKDGWKIYYLADEEIIHMEGAASKKTSNKYFGAILQRESNHYFLRKHFGNAEAVKFKLVICVGSLIRILTIILLIPNLMLVQKRRDILFIIGKYYNLFLWSIGMNKKLR